MFFIFVQSEISCRMHNFRLIGRGLEQISDKSVSAVADSDLDDFRIASFSVSVSNESLNFENVTQCVEEQFVY